MDDGGINVTMNTTQRLDCRQRGEGGQTAARKRDRVQDKSFRFNRCGVVLDPGGDVNRETGVARRSRHGKPV